MGNRSVHACLSFLKIKAIIIVFPYTIMDVYSHKTVGYQMYDFESGELAAALITNSFNKEKVQEKQLIHHSDNGEQYRRWRPLRGVSVSGPRKWHKILL